MNLEDMDKFLEDRIFPAKRDVEYTLAKAEIDTLEFEIEKSEDYDTEFAKIIVTKTGLYFSGSVSNAKLLIKMLKSKSITAKTQIKAVYDNKNEYVGWIFSRIN
jgi:hypothetical protein